METENQLVSYFLSKLYSDLCARLLWLAVKRPLNEKPLNEKPSATNKKKRHSEFESGAVELIIATAELADLRLRHVD